VRERLHITFNEAGHSRRSVKKLLRAIGLAEVAEADPGPLGLYTAALWRDDKRVESLRTALDDAGLGYFERRELVFDETELTSAPLLRLIVRRSPKGSGGLNGGTRYDFASACSTCGTGARQTSPLSLKASGLPRRGDVVETGQGELLVSPSLGRALRSTGVKQRKVRSATSGDALPWVQLESDVELPPWSAETRGGARESACSRCDRDGHFDSAKNPLRIAYDAADLDVDELPDAVHTFECFGNSRRRKLDGELVQVSLARPLTLVKPRLRERLLERGVRKLDFEPVQLIET
jgi:hypothetical protein